MDKAEKFHEMEEGKYLAKLRIPTREQYAYIEIEVYDSLNNIIKTYEDASRKYWYQGELPKKSKKVEVNISE